MTVTQIYDPVSGTSRNLDGKFIAGLLSGTPTSVVRKILNAAAAAKSSNWLINTPLIAPPAWAGASAYIAGNVVTNDSGKQYICYSGGTSAASGGPTGFGTGAGGNGPITDGTVTWYYMGQKRPAASDTNAPTITYPTSVPAGLTVAYDLLNTPNVFQVAGGTPVNIGGTTYSFPAINQAPTSGNAWTTYNMVNCAIQFMSDAPKLAINGTSPLYAQYQFTVEVDNQLISDGALGTPTDVSPNGALVIDWGGVRKARRYRIFISPNFKLAKISIDPQSKMWAAYNPHRYRMAVLGDSLTAGGNAFPISPGRDWPSQLGALVGCDDVWNLGSGGCGFINDSSGNKKRHIDRLADVTGIGPDVLLIGGSNNDVSYTNDQQQSSIKTYLQVVRQALPNCIIVCFGTIAGSSGPSAAITATDTNMQTVVNALNDPYILFTSTINDPAGSWMTGTGKVTAQTGTGNADVITSSDGTHPVQMGIDFLARRYANSYLNAITPLSY